MKKFVLLAVATIVALLTFRLWPDPPAHDEPTSHGTTVVAAPASSAPVPAEPSTATTSSTHPQGPYSSSEAAKKIWQPAVQGFALAYPDTAGSSRKEWLANLRPYLARDVLHELANTDLSKVPAGHYAGYQVLKQADEAATLRVTYQEGWAIVVYLVAVNDRTWLVESFDYSEDWD